MRLQRQFLENCNLRKKYNVTTLTQGQSLTKHNDTALIDLLFVPFGSLMGESETISYRLVNIE